MTYTFVGEKELIEKEVNKISKDYASESISLYNLEIDSIGAALEDINTIGLFGDKLIIINNIENASDDSLVEYFNNQISNTLILTSYKKLDARKKITKVLKEKTKLNELFGIDLSDYIRKQLDDYKITNMAINILISYCNSNINRIDNELEKLKVFKLEEKVINEDDVKEVVKESYESTVFNLIDEINLKNKKKIYKIYYELLQSGFTEERIMYTIANHYRLLFQIKCKLENESDEDIVKEYGMHPYRLKKLKEQLRILTDEDILFILKTLGDIDIKSKRGETEVSTGLILFFENL